MTSETSPGSTRARSSAALMAILPSSCAGRLRQRAVERADRRARGTGDDDGGLILAHPDAPGLVRVGAAAGALRAAARNERELCGTIAELGFAAATILMLCSVPGDCTWQRHAQQTAGLAGAGVLPYALHNWPASPAIDRRSCSTNRIRASDKKEPVVIKKYANRRLYNTETSTYVTLDDLAAMVKSERDFVVFDAKTGDDLTHAVLTQIIVDQESRMGSADAAADPVPAPADPLLRRQHRALRAELSAGQPGDAGQGAGALPQAVRRCLHAGRRLRGLSGAGAQEPRHVRAGDG